MKEIFELLGNKIIENGFSVWWLLILPFAYYLHQIMTKAIDAFGEVLSNWIKNHYKL